MAKVVFSGESKTIIVNAGVTDIDVQVDLYSDWKEWVTQADNSKYLAAFRTFGGDDTIAGQNAPRYFFLINGWYVLVDNGEVVNVGLNLYTDDYTTPYVVGAGSGVSDRNSDAVVVSPEITQTLDYFGRVNLNPVAGVTGTTYPIGTLARPSNNLIDAKAIADSRGIDTINIYGTVPFNTDLENYIVEGGKISDIVYLQGYSVEGSTFRQCVLFGNYTGSIAAEVCQLAGSLSGVNGTFKDCGLIGDIYAAEDSTINLLNCSSLVAGTGTPSITFPDAGANFLSMRKFGGGFTLASAGSGFTGTIEYNAGKCFISSACTGGYVSVRGVAYLEDNSSSAMTVDTTALIQPTVFDVLPDELVASQSSVDNVQSSVDGLSLSGGSLTAAQDIKLDELHLLHGLNTAYTLSVTMTGRSVSNIDQTFSTSGTTAGGDKITEVDRIP